MITILTCLIATLTCSDATATGLVTIRTCCPVFARVLLDLQAGKAGVLICDDVSRIARDERDALDLIDACELEKASAFSPSEDSADGIGPLRITGGGTREEIRASRERARAAHDYSADISEKVQRGRKRWAGKSYWGGRRPYGRMIDPSAPKHAKRLLTVPEEAKVLQDAITDVLDQGISLHAVAADPRARGMRTTTGKPFSAESLRDALLASHQAGIATCNGAQYDASSWLEPIIEPDRWERLVDMLTDPGRRTNTSNANAQRLDRNSRDGDDLGHAPRPAGLAQQHAKVLPARQPAATNQRQAAPAESRERRRRAQITAATTLTARTETAPGSQDGMGSVWLTDVLSSPAGRDPNSPRSCV